MKPPKLPPVPESAEQRLARELLKIPAESAFLRNRFPEALARHLMPMFPGGVTLDKNGKAKAIAKPRIEDGTFLRGASRSRMGDLGQRAGDPSHESDA